MTGTEPRPPDLTPQAEARSAARLAALRSPGPAVTEAVWEDAQRQLAGMLEGLETLQRAVPALGQPADAASGTPSVSPTSTRLGHAEQEAPRQEGPQQGEGARP